MRKMLSRTSAQKQAKNLMDPDARLEEWGKGLGLLYINWPVLWVTNKGESLLVIFM